jgi:hypothetical protein
MGYHLPYAVLALLALSSIAVANPMTADEIRSLNGKTCIWKNGNNGGRSTYFPDGSAKEILDNGTALTGKWHFKGNQVCDQWGNQKKETCYSITRTGPNTYSGSIGFTSTCK